MEYADDDARAVGALDGAFEVARRLPRRHDLGKARATERLAVDVEEVHAGGEVLVRLAGPRGGAGSSTARWLYCRMVPVASQTKVAIGSMSRMPSDARSTLSSVREVDWVRRVLSFAPSIRTAPRVDCNSPYPRQHRA